MPIRRIVLAEYFSTQERTLLFIIRSDFVEPEVVEIETPMDEVRQFVAAHFHTANGDSNVRNLDLEEWQTRFGRLVEPILPWTDEGDVVWLVPHDVFHYLPLHALKVEGRYLIERNPICYTHSASVMQYCRSKRKPFKGGQALILGDSDDKRPLPFARIEAQRIADLFDCEPALGVGASKHVVLDALRDLPRRQALDVLHFACHGYFDPAQALKSHVVLAPANGSGNLTAEEILGLQMHAELVVLSACESGVNERRPGDELVGLTRALIYAGTSSVLVSLWAVDDLSTTLLMEKFYTGWRGGLSKAEALQFAQCWLRNLQHDELQAQAGTIRDMTKSVASVESDGNGWTRQLLRRLEPEVEEFSTYYGSADRPFSHPYYWAPFILVGDWN